MADFIGTTFEDPDAEPSTNDQEMVTIPKSQLAEFLKQQSLIREKQAMIDDLGNQLGEGRKLISSLVEKLGDKENTIPQYNNPSPVQNQPDPWADLGLGEPQPAVNVGGSREPKYITEDEIESYINKAFHKRYARDMEMNNTLMKIYQDFEKKHPDLAKGKRKDILQGNFTARIQARGLEALNMTPEDLWADYQATVKQGYEMLKAGTLPEVEEPPVSSSIPKKSIPEPPSFNTPVNMEPVKKSATKQITYGPEFQKAELEKEAERRRNLLRQMR